MAHKPIKDKILISNKTIENYLAMQRINILGVNVDSLSNQELISIVEKMIEGENQNYIVTPNPEFIVNAQQNLLFKDILNNADLSLPDGIGLKYAAKLQGKKITRITGVDALWQICELASQNGYSIYLLGGKENIAKKAAAKLQAKYPQLDITGAESGGMIDNQGKSDISLINAINQDDPDILFVALGQIKQETWIYRNLDKLPNIKLAIGVGGAFDYISGNVSRAPQWMRRLGFEWLFRLYQQPWRARRIFDATVVFSWLVIKNLVLKK
jgi:N-acetylglucosaminyldiphosphoundecaprenol N-acetyl-beta-D-mannosaminyltransferase